MKEENVKTNFLYQSAYQILTILLPMLLSPYVARVLGAEGIGTYSYTYSIVSYFVMAAGLGLHNYGNRCIAAARDDKEKLSQTFSDLYALHGIITAVIMAAYGMYIMQFGGEHKIIFLIQGFYLVGQLLDINWFFFGIEKFKLTVTRNAVIKLLTVLCVFLFVRTKADLWKYVSILAIGAAASESVVWFFVKRYVDFVRPNAKSFKKHIGPMLVLFIPSIAVSVYKIMDKIMLGGMTGTFAVGLYENSEKIINICIGFVTALGTVMLPRMSHLVATGRVEESEKMVQKSSRFILILSYGMCFGVIGVSKVFPTVFWGDEFRSCDVLLLGLAVSLPFTAIANVVRTQILIPQHREKPFVIAVCVGAVVNFIINCICIPKLNAFGAVIGTVCAEAVVCLIQLMATQKRIPIWKYIIQSVPFAGVGLIMAVAVRIMGNMLGTSVVSLLAQVFIGGFVYCAISLAYMIIIRDDLLGLITTKIIKKAK